MKSILEFIELKAKDNNLMFVPYVKTIQEHYLNKRRGIVALVFDSLFEENKNSSLSEVFSTLITFLRNLLSGANSWEEQLFKAHFCTPSSLFAEFISFHENSVLNFLEPKFENETSIEEICSCADIALGLNLKSKIDPKLKNIFSFKL